MGVAGVVSVVLRDVGDLAVLPKRGHQILDALRRTSVDLVLRHQPVGRERLQQRFPFLRRRIQVPGRVRGGRAVLVRDGRGRCRHLLRFPRVGAVTGIGVVHDWDR
uniref:(northern house mosquito) hypothetical protein n=1 Tax=Culex pipiens TaxID=7175 RepID=A0A8D7ZXY8_CULPI